MNVTSGSAEAAFDRARLASWVGRTFAFDEKASRGVVRQVETQLAGIGRIELTALRTIATRAALDAYAFSALPRIFAVIDPTQFVGPVTELAKFLIEQLKGRGFELDPADGSYIKENSVGAFHVFDAKAPRANIKLSAGETCCDPSKSDAKLDEPVNDELVTTDGVQAPRVCSAGSGGICVSFEITMSDKTTGFPFGGDSGVDHVRITSLTKGPIGLSNGPSRDFKLKDNEREATRDGDFKVTEYMCVPCELADGDKMHFSIVLTDDSGNVRIYFVSCGIAAAKKKCCGG